MRHAFRLISIFWILSPIGFVALRALRVFDYPCDWGIGLFLAFMSTASAFLNVKEDEQGY